MLNSTVTVTKIKTAPIVYVYGLHIYMKATIIIIMFFSYCNVIIKSRKIQDRRRSYMHIIVDYIGFVGFNITMKVFIVVDT
jgi:hypothetical protein